MRGGTAATTRTPTAQTCRPGRTGLARHAAHRACHHALIARHEVERMHCPFAAKLGCNLSIAGAKVGHRSQLGLGPEPGERDIDRRGLPGGCLGTKTRMVCVKKFRIRLQAAQAAVSSWPLRGETCQGDHAVTVYARLLANLFTRSKGQCDGIMQKQTGTVMASETKRQEWCDGIRAEAFVAPQDWRSVYFATKTPVQEQTTAVLHMTAWNQQFNRQHVGDRVLHCPE